MGLEKDIYAYHYVSQGKTTVNGIDDDEEMKMTDVRHLSCRRHLLCGFLAAIISSSSNGVKLLLNLAVLLNEERVANGHCSYLTADDLCHLVALSDVYSGSLRHLEE